MWWNASNRHTMSKAFAGSVLASTASNRRLAEPLRGHRLVRLRHSGGVDVEADEPRRGEPPGEDAEGSPATWSDLGDLDSALERGMQIRVTRDPLRDEQLLVHRRVDTLGRHAERGLELVRADPAPSRIAVSTLGSSAPNGTSSSTIARTSSMAPPRRRPMASSTGAYRASVTVA